MTSRFLTRIKLAQLPCQESTINSENWISLTEVLSLAGMKQLIRTLHAVIEIGERFPVWHQKRERGLRALTDPVTLKVKQMNVKLGHAGQGQSTGKIPQHFSVPAEPITPLSELRRYLLRVTPIMTEGYLSYCYGIVGATILLSSDDPEVAVVTGFEVLVGELPLPIHTIQRAGNHQRVLLAMHEHRALGLAPLEKPRLHDFQVALGRLLVAAGCSAYPTLLKMMRARQAPESDPMEETPNISSEAEELHQAALQAMTQCEGNGACEVLDVELARIVALTDEKPQGTTPSDNTVHPHMRVHIVSLVASDEIPFDIFWPMVRDDILGAVREACPRAHHSSESAIQAGSGQVSGRSAVNAYDLNSNLNHYYVALVVCCRECDLCSLFRGILYFIVLLACIVSFACFCNHATSNCASLLSFLSST